jgi:hypothetical protein
MKTSVYYNMLLTLPSISVKVCILINSQHYPYLINTVHQFTARLLKQRSLAISELVFAVVHKH